MASLITLRLLSCWHRGGRRLCPAARQPPRRSCIRYPAVQDRGSTGYYEETRFDSSHKTVSRGPWC
jgi:hypothetical protein